MVTKPKHCRQGVLVAATPLNVQTAEFGTTVACLQPRYYGTEMCYLINIRPKD